jgi:hypothetical protein
VAARAGHSSSLDVAPLDDESKSAPVDDMQPGAYLEQKYPAELAEAVDAALTDAELFDSYNLPLKAIAPLEGALTRVPNDVRVNQRLASLYARCGKLKQAAERCAVLQKVYQDAGYVSDAARFSELAEKHLGRAVKRGDAPPATPAVPAAVAPASPAIVEIGPTAVADPTPLAAQPVVPTVPATPPPATTEDAHEFDLSDEWDQMLEVESAPSAAVNAAASPAQTPSAYEEPANTTAWESFDAEDENGPDEAVSDLLDEIRFYLSQSMWAEARTAIEHCEALAPASAELARLKEVVAGQASTTASPDIAELELVTDGTPLESDLIPEPLKTELPALAPTPAAPIMPAVPQVFAAPADSPPAMNAAAIPDPAASEQSHDLLEGFVLDLEASLGDNFTIAKPPLQVPVPEVAAAVRVPDRAMATAAPAAVVSAPAIPQPVPQSPVQEQVATIAAASYAAPATVASTPLDQDEDAPNALSDIFAEFKESMEAGSEAQEDPETHYNLGVAFKEMGLLDEAIGELQKVCQSIERGQTFPQAMQAYTWLADCFLQRGVPEAAVRWYEKALKSQYIDSETATAVHYELACAHEAAGDRAAALRHFMEVYGTNIDYRDVAERIKDLKS